MWRRSVFRGRVVRPADRLIAISEATRADAVRILNSRSGEDRRDLPRRGGGVLPGGHGGSGGGQSATRSRASIRAVCGDHRAAKNVGRLLDAWAGLPRALRDEFDLVVAGPARLAAARDAGPPAQSGPGVRYLGYVPGADMPGLVAGHGVRVPLLIRGLGIPGGAGHGRRRPGGDFRRLLAAGNCRRRGRAGGPAQPGGPDARARRMC